jgi:hypothetical protein
MGGGTGEWMGAGAGTHWLGFAHPREHPRARTRPLALPPLQDPISFSQVPPIATVCSECTRALTYDVLGR